MRLRLAALSALLSLILMTGAQPPREAAADTSSDLAQAQAEAALIAQVRAQLGGTLADELSAQQQLEISLKQNAEQQVVTQQKITDTSRRIGELDDQITATDAEIKATDDRIEVERAQLKSLARSIYAQPASMLVLLAESNTLSELVSRATELNVAGNRARALKQKLAEDEAKLDVQRAKQQADKNEQVKLRQGLTADLEKLRKLAADQEESKRKLETKIAQTQNELNALASQSSALAAQVASLLQQQELQIVAAAMQQVWDQVQLWEQQNGGSVNGLGTSPGHSKTRMIWPMQFGPISQGFGPSSLGFEPPAYGYANFHTGIDIANPTGTPIMAADDGIVVLVGAGTTGYGNYVVLAHAGGLSTLYGHLSQALVKQGDRITQGQPIGLEGSTGLSTGPHLHFEVRNGNKPVDPTPFLPPGGPSPSKG